MKLINSTMLILCLACPLAVAAAEVTDPVLGSYRGLTLTEGDLLREIEGVKMLKNTSEEPDRNVIFTLVDHLLLRRVLAEEAEQKQLIPADELEARLQRQRELWLSQARMESLARELTDEQLDEAAQEIYTAHKDDYRSEERVDVSHILIRARSEGRDEAASLALTGELHAKLMADPTAFEALAEEYSEDDKTAVQGGSLGWMEAKRLVKPFKDATLALQPGHISLPVKTRFGFHLIRLNAHEPEAQLPYEQVRERLMKQARQQARKSAIDTYLSKLKLSPDYVYDEAAVQRFYQQQFSAEGERLDAGK